MGKKTVIFFILLFLIWGMVILHKSPKTPEVKQRKVFEIPLTASDTDGNKLPEDYK